MKKVAKPLGLDPVEAAWGIHQVVNENMASAARIHAVEKGKDVRNYSLYASGGAGPVHVGNVANILGVNTIVLPVGAGVNSAFGFLTSPLAFDFVRSFYGRLHELNWAHVMTLVTEMEEEGKQLLARAGVGEGITVIRKADMKYRGQTHEITVSLPLGNLGDQEEEIVNRFKDAYRELYAEANEEMEIETLNWRVIVQGPEPVLQLKSTEESGFNPTEKATRNVYFGEWIDTPVYEREQLFAGVQLKGPAIIEERESTVVVPPAFLVTLDRSHNIILERKVTDQEVSTDAQQSTTRI
nr:hydantoinase/oxoprolinase family protein [Geomicrobium sp. JCM 19037]